MNLISILFLSFFFSCSKKTEITSKPIYKVKSEIIKVDEGIKKFSYPGEIRATVRSVLSFDISGKIINSNRREGEKVKKGALLAQLDVLDYKLNLEKAEATFQTAKAEFERAKILWASEAISKSEFDATKANFISKRSEMEKVRKNFKNTSMKAPYDGVIGKIFVKNFEEVKPNQEIIKFYDASKWEILINVPESHLAALPQKRKISASAMLPDRPEHLMKLTFKELSGEVDSKTRSYEAAFKVENDSTLLLMPGMTVKVDVLVENLDPSSSKKIFIPSISILEDNQRNKYVLIVDSKKFVAVKRIITVSSIREDRIQVISGLSEGERVITAGANLIQHGDKVELLEETGGL